MSVTHRIDYLSLSGKAIKVAIIDSGIDTTHPRIGQLAGGVHLSLNSDGDVLRGADFGDRSGHGTACAGIIRNKAPEAELYAIRIFDEPLITDGRRLVAALRWAIDNRMDVVNLSLGTRDISCRHELAELSLEAAAANVILVAAAANSGEESYPAMLPQVIGVAGGKLYGRYTYLFREGEHMECVARGDEQRLCWLMPREVMSGGTSFAAPHITGLVTLIREAFPQAALKVVRRILRENATGRSAKCQIGREGQSMPGRRRGGRALGSQHPRIAKATLYPFNKEMHSFVRYRDQLDFEIAGVADPAGKGLGGRDAGEAIGVALTGVRITPRLTEALDAADTLILGYVDELAPRDTARCP